MTYHTKRFGELIDTLVHHIALKKGGKQKYQVAEMTVAHKLSVSQSTIQTWRQGKHMPADPEAMGEQLVQFGVEGWGLERAWAEAVLIHTRHPERIQLLARLFPERGGLTPLWPDQPSGVESPEDPVPLGSPFYVARLKDRQALEAITRRGVTLTIKGPAKMGKTSLLYRVRNAAEEAGKRTVCLNFREFGSQTLQDTNAFFRQFCHRLSEELGLDDQVAAIWNPASTNPANCRRYITRTILQKMDRPVVLALENVDTIFGSPFRSDFFGMLRSWHDDSQYRPIWQKLDRVLVTSTEPYQFIEDLTKSPFNVGEVIELDDFTSAQVADLNRRYDSPLTANDLEQLMDLLNGHPYLVRRSLHLVAQAFIAAADLFATASHDDGPFRGHLAALLADLLTSNAELRQAFQAVIKQHTPPEYAIFFRLRGAGLVRREGQAVWPRCQLYADFFQERLDD